MSAQGPATAVGSWTPHIVAFVCRWCTYAGADMAGTTRLHYPSSVRLLKFPCTGRMNPMFIVNAFERGADGVLVSGCHPGDCHYVHGNLVARRRFTVFRSLVELLGLDQRRLHFSWVSAAESHKWVQVVEGVDGAVQAAGPLPPWTEASEPTDLPPALLDEVEDTRTPPPESELSAVTYELRRLVGRLLDEGEVQRVLAFAPGSLPGQTVLATISSSNDARRLVWSSDCHTNLSVYLTRALSSSERVGVVVKACDVKSVVGLIQEGQVRRDDVVLIGVPCSGVWQGGSLADKCTACTGEIPALCDHRVEPAGVSAPTGAGAAPPDRRDVQLEALMAMPAEKRWAFWQAQFRRCLRCYACRAVCPLCYCETCIADRHRPQWISNTIDGRGNTAWNTVRAFHLAGRCTGCDECTRACPADIRLDLLNRHLALEVERHYGYRSGEDLAAAPVMTEFRAEDPEEFIL